MSRAMLIADSQFPTLEFPKLGGGSLSVGGAKDKWTLFLVYRGKHCARCKKYFAKLNSMISAWEALGFHIIAVSADTEEKADQDVKEFGWNFDVGYGLSVEQMEQIGVYISEPLSDAETDRPFAEPGIFCISPDGRAHINAISNAPSARPDLDELLDGMTFNINNDRPTRGTA